ncbi:MAG: histidinol-phosphate transaminase [Desulfohalobiaceae bacterium]
MKLLAQVRNLVHKIPPYSPGLSTQEIEKLFQLQKVVKLASNENPLGTPSLAQKALEKNISQAFRYPRAGCPELRQSLAQELGVPPGCIFIGNGSDEIIDLLFRVKAEPGQNNAVMFEPCFSIYYSQALLFGIETRRVPLNPDFSFPFSGLLQKVNDQTALVFITNPDNPSGYSVPARDIKSLAERLPQNCLLVVDEAYVEFADQPEDTSALSLFDSLQNTVVLRTFSKIFGLAGLRLGYAVLPSQLADYLQRIKLPFSVNLMAEQAGIAALKDKNHYQTTRETIIQGRRYLQKGLQELGCRVYPSQANFLLFQPPVSAKVLFEELLRQGLILRSLESYGLGDHLRVSIGKPEENQLLLQLMQEILK